YRLFPHTSRSFGGAEPAPADCEGRVRFQPALQYDAAVTLVPIPPLQLTEPFGHGEPLVKPLPRLRLQGFNNLTKALSFNIYDICYAVSEDQRGRYIEYIDEQYD